jgi:hypothetical protein
LAISSLEKVFAIVAGLFFFLSFGGKRWQCKKRMAGLGDEREVNRRREWGSENESERMSE